MDVYTPREIARAAGVDEARSSPRSRPQGRRGPVRGRDITSPRMPTRCASAARFGRRKPPLFSLFLDTFPRRTAYAGDAAAARALEHATCGVHRRRAPHRRDGTDAKAAGAARRRSSGTIPCGSCFLAVPGPGGGGGAAGASDSAAAGGLNARAVTRSAARCRCSASAAETDRAVPAPPNRSRAAAQSGATARRRRADRDGSGRLARSHRRARADDSGERKSRPGRGRWHGQGRRNRTR